MTVPYQLVDRDDALTDELARIGTRVVGIDVERADAQQYFRSPALVQVGDADTCVLIDTLAVTEVGPINTFVAAQDTLVLHAGENDYEPLAAKGIRLGPCEDTSVAASLLGLPIGLANLLRDQLAVDTPNKNRFQRADWAKRPLPPAMLAYAASDVIHLPALWQRLHGELVAVDRLGWYVEECKRVRDRAANRSRSVTKLKGAGALSPAERAVLSCVWDAREAHARTHNIAPNFLVHDDVLLAIARQPPADLAALHALLAKREVSQAFAPTLWQALDAGLSHPPVLRDTPRFQVDESVHDALKHARTDVAKQIGLDAGVLAPATALRHAVSQPVRSGEEILVHAGLDGWRTALLADVLWEAYTTSTSRAVCAPDSPAD